MSTEQVEFATCQRCSRPYPVSISGASLCHPCRKRVRAERRGREPQLTGSDLALEAIHLLYDRRDEGWRVRLDGLEGEIDRLQMSNSELSDQNLRILDENARLNEIVIEARAKVADAAEGATLRQRVKNLEAANRRLNRQVNDLTGDRNMWRKRAGEAESAAAVRGAFGAIFGQAGGPLAGNLPDGVTVNDLIRLTHPDRHAGGKLERLANEVTKWLIPRRR